MIADIATDADRLHVDHREPAPADPPRVGLAPEREPQVLDRVVERGVASFRARHPGRTIEVIEQPAARDRRGR